MEVADASEKEDLDNSNICDRFSVSIYQTLSHQPREIYPSTTDFDKDLLLISACVTSILRTYYAWQIVQSRDISYNAAKMGFWTYAEIAIGTIVSCMPVLPKFFRHFSPKIYATFASKSKSKLGSSSNPRQAKSQSPVMGEKPGNSAKSSFEKPFITKGSGRGETGVLGIWNEAYHPSAAVQVTGEYVTLDEYDSVLPGTDTAGELAPRRAKGIATRRDDLENGIADRRDYSCAKEMRF